MSREDCWSWNGKRDRDGYARFSGKLAHRLVYEAFGGAIPEGFDLDHLCRERSCVNPFHMEPVTHAENVRRSEPATKTHCKNGHEFTEENTYARLKSGKRQCRTCNRLSARSYRVRVGGAA